MIRLSVQIDSEREDRIFQGSIVEVGRSRSCDLSLRDEGLLSRHHCRFTLIDGRCEVEDLSSRNGIRVNGIVIRNAIVEVGDEVRLGDVTLELMEFGLDESEPEQVRPCLDCGEIIAATRTKCPKCASLPATPPKRRALPPDHIEGYTLRRRIGSGGMGIVFEALRHEDEETCAIKILKPHLAKKHSYVARFVEETRVLTLLRHDNIVRVFGRGSDKGLTYIDMELVRGDSVRHVIRHEGAMAEDRALEIVWEVVLALDYAHRQHVVHGDVKPSNFLLDSHGVVKLCDFGLARFMKFGRPPRLGGPALSPDASGRKGTAAYAAPERFLEDAKPTVVGDIYSLGISLYQMLTTALPFGSNKSAMRHRERTSAPDISHQRPELRRATSMLVARMTAVDPADRYQTYVELQNDLALLIDR